MVDQAPGQPEYQFDWQDPKYVKQPYQVGRVMSRTYKGVLKQKKPIGLAVLAYVALTIIISLLFSVIFRLIGFELDSAQNGAEAVSTVFATMSAILGWLGIVFIMIVTDAAVFSEYTKRPVSFKTLARTAFRKMIPLTFGLLVFFVAYYIGIILLIIPGLFIYYGWGIFGPIYVNENTGLIASFGRSWDLMKGYKRWYFLSNLVIGMINGMVFYVLIFVFIGLFSVLISNNPASSSSSGFGMALFFGLLSTTVLILSFLLYAVFMASMTTATYLEVKQLKEGAGHADIADVFV